MKRVQFIYGTRPEAIKLAPLIGAIRSSAQLQSEVVTTGQHREMLDQVNKAFDIKPALNIDVFEHHQTLNRLMGKVFDRLDAVLTESSPDAVVVQGDTSTVTAAAIAAFYRRIPVVHLEAGLRSGDLFSPFPEEMNRRLVSRVASLHLAPTPRSKLNLLHEGIDSDAIVVTGNTVIDALLETVSRGKPFEDGRLAELEKAGRPIVLVTTHRRENWGSAMSSIGRALARLSREFPDHLFVFPAHRNPIVRQAILPHVDGCLNFLTTQPLPYGDFTRLMSLAVLVMTDSGGVQEEAPSLGKPVLVMRENTERPEAVEAGTVRLIGTSEERIVKETSILLRVVSRGAMHVLNANPYGDGHASKRAAAAIAGVLGVGARLPDFDPEATNRPAQLLGPEGSPSLDSEN